MSDDPAAEADPAAGTDTVAGTGPAAEAAAQTEATGAGDAVIRRMRWFDIAPIAALDAEIFGADAWSEAYFWSELAAPGRHFIVLDAAAVGNAASPELLGFAGLSVSGPQADILTIASHPDARRQGIGRRLLDALLDHARANGVEAVHLDVRADNTAAQAMYAADGFVELDRRPGYYRDADAVLMRALL
ncbi:ribosomal protein S18-alanine N-acetyltransferase [Brevibacterium luteolum]|uniref:ribosomal protein S18-alanine N-acetyltransferase n=1 Tax=Brevibacterium luteolum TaxID=199591 RepID=UPI0021AF46D5|nr:ribosomal protein S18-alanine N-acetyltransferase [Brevibacterium luteolum]MCT1656721.1 ribosomal protein S18-alanine N-acetyltransferase [Brevibacterium luteolum]MCT1829634.1 ribosomal protein S18-alanine N-acetyltransferase [Brevibacterium luteolum]